MKKIRFLMFCLSLAALLVLSLVACTTGGTGEATGTSTGTETTTESATETDTTEAPSETVPESETDTTDATDTDESTTETSVTIDYSGEEYIQIKTVEDLMNFNKAVNEPADDANFDDKIVVFLADIDLAGQEWVPLDGEIIPYITFDGQGHTIKNMTINYNLDRSIAEPYVGAGFVGTVPSYAELVFKNMVFEDAKVVARERHIGCLVGRSLGGTCTFENITVKNFTVDGWCDYHNTTEDTGGYPIAFRVAGVMGASWGGDHTFTNVTVENLNISGFHNLAGILGYDASGLISEYSFENCKVENAKMVFSYCLADVYSVDMPRKFVSVFFCGPNWVDNIDACVEQGNTFSGVSFYDYTSTEEVDEYGNRKVDLMTEYTPDNFRSWTEEEANPA